MRTLVVLDLQPSGSKGEQAVIKGINCRWEGGGPRGRNFQKVCVVRMQNPWRMDMKPISLAGSQTKYIHHPYLPRRTVAALGAHYITQ